MVNQDIKIDIDADQIDLTFFTPKSIPSNTVRENIAAWQKDVGKIEIKEANFIAGDVKINGAGTIGLDDNLQLQSGFKTKTYGYDTAIQFFMTAGTVKPIMGALAVSGLNALAQDDPITGQKYVALDIAITNQKMFFGPLKIDNLPKIQWR